MLNIRPEYQFTFSDWQRSLLILRDYPEDEDLPTDVQAFVDALEVAREMKRASGQWPTYAEVQAEQERQKEAEQCKEVPENEQPQNPEQN